MLLCNWCALDFCLCVVGQCIPPLVLVAPTAPVLLLTVPSDVLGEAIIPLRRRRVAEPELLLCGVGGMRAHAADINIMLRAALDAAPSLIAALHLAALESKGALDPRPPTSCSATACRPRHANPLVVVDELVRELAKEFEAACLLVVRMDHLLKKKVGIDADDAKDSEVEHLVPMSGGEIAVHPQFVGADPVVPVNGAGTLVICCHRPRLGDLDNDLFRWRTTGLV
jgi:hypothetical protein